MATLDSEVSDSYIIAISENDLLYGYMLTFFTIFFIYRYT